MDNNLQRMNNCMRKATGKSTTSLLYLNFVSGYFFTLRCIIVNLTDVLLLLVRTAWINDIISMFYHCYRFQLPSN